VPAGTGPGRGGLDAGSCPKRYNWPAMIVLRSVAGWMKSEKPPGFYPGGKDARPGPRDKPGMPRFVWSGTRHLEKAHPEAEVFRLLDVDPVPP